MKRYFCAIIVLLWSCDLIHAQSTPQFDFNSEYDYSHAFRNSDGDFDDYLNIQLMLIFKSDLNNKEKLKLYHRLYEIEHTSTISYQTVDDNPLKFHTPSDTLFLNATVDFGTILESNNKQREGFKMRFKSPVTKIDPALFAETVSYIKLPFTGNLEYKPSRSTCVTYLVAIEGKDVIDNDIITNYGRSLVDTNGTLVVAAVADLSSYSIPKQVKAIGDGALRGCVLEEIVIPQNVTSIGEAAFELCAKLKTVTIFSEIPIEIKDSSFETGKESDYVIYVPKQCYKDYRKKYPLLKKRFKAIRE